ncbi:MAG: hypothetical protein ABII18_13305 [bacterium]|nr:hypothetical protein [bacterium]MBU1916712.1 hypothetical protein [bacterium]
MYKQKTPNELLYAILRGEQNINGSHLENLSIIDRSWLLNSLFEQAKDKKVNKENCLRISCTIVPYLEPEKRYAALTHIISILYTDTAGLIKTKDFFNTHLMRSLQPLELISFAYLLSDSMSHKNVSISELAMWGLSMIIPLLHSVNQKEFAYDIYLVTTMKNRHKLGLDCLTDLLFNIDNAGRHSLIFFFSEMLKKDDTVARYFIIDLLTKMTAALPEEERTSVADAIAPLIYFNDTILVRKSLNYFATVISLLPSSERFYYTQMIAGLINDHSLKQDVIKAIEKALPFLANEHEKMIFLELLSQFSQEGEPLESSHVEACLQDHLEK